MLKSDSLSLTVAMFALVLGSKSTAMGQTPSGPATPVTEYVEVVLPATTSGNGQAIVRWSNVAESIAEAMTLDREAVAGMLPTGEINLDDGMVGLLLLGLNVAADGAVVVDRVRVENGSPGLRVRCRRDLLPTSKFTSARGDAQYDVDADWKLRTKRLPLVVFLHGMQSSGDAFVPLRGFVRDIGYATSAVTYDFNASIQESAKTVSRLVTQRVNLDETKTTELILIGHSMGGLVAREWTENRALPGSDITRLITIGSPHRGSNWASLPPLLGLFSGGPVDGQQLIDVLLHQPSSAGMRDLVPGSSFITTLNDRPLRKDVRYTAIVGSGSPVSAQDATNLRRELQRLDQDGTFLRLIRPRIRPLLESFDELAQGKGDGVVSAESGRLNASADNVIVNVSHFDMVRAFGRLNGETTLSPVWKIIQERLSTKTDE